MNGGRKSMAVVLIAIVGIFASVANSVAAAFVAWEVSGISSDDVLMVRAYPSSTSRILVGYPDGVTLSMTGKCTGGVRLDDIQALPSAEQRDLVRTKLCEVWLDPYGNGEFRAGWVFGRYIRPN